MAYHHCSSRHACENYVSKIGAMCKDCQYEQYVADCLEDGYMPLPKEQTAARA